MAAAMAATKTPVVQAYEETKAELAAMEYYDFLGIESLELVRSLLADLVMTTTSHEKQQEKIETMERELALTQESVFTLRRENSRLVRENNQLHIDMIRRAEDLDEQERALQAKLQEANDRTSEAKFAADQFKRRLDTAERALSAARQAGTQSQPPSPPRADLSMSQALGEAAPVPGAPGQQSESASERNVAMLEERLAGITREASELRGKLAHVSKQVELRDAEVIRLGKELARREFAPQSAAASATGTAENPAAEGPEPTRQLQQARFADEKVVAQLYDQIDFLSAQLQDKESKLQKAGLDGKLLEQARAELKRKDNELAQATTRLGEAVAAREKLSDENSKRKANEADEIRNAAQEARDALMDPQRLETALSAAKSDELGALLEAYREDKLRFGTTVQRLEQSAVEFRTRAEQLEHELHERVALQVKAEEDAHKARAERQRLEGELGDAQRALAKLHEARLSAEETSAAMTGEVGSLEQLVEDQRADLGTLRGELERARTAEQTALADLKRTQAELERKEREAGGLQDRMRHADHAMESLEQERDALQRQVDRVLAELRTAKVAAQDARAEIQGAKSEADHYQGRCRVLEDEVRSLTQQLVRKSEEYLKEAGVRAELEELSTLPSVIGELEEQVARWRARAADLDTESKRVARALDSAQTEIRETNAEREQLERAVADLRAGRAEVAAQLREARNQVEEMSVKLETVTADRDSLVKLSKASSEQLSQRTAASAAADAEMDHFRLEAQRAEAKVEAAARREAVLREQLQSARDNLGRAEAAKLALEENLQTVKTERDRTRESVAALEREVQQLRGEERELSESLRGSEERARELAAQVESESRERSKLAAHLEQFKTVFSKLDETRANLQDRVRELHTALQKEKANFAALEKNQKSVEEVARAATEKRGHLERALKEARDHNERLVAQLESRSKAAHELESAVSKQELTYRELEQRLGAAKRQLHAQSQALETRDGDLQETQEALAAAKRTIAHLEQMCKARTSELKSAAQDLANMTRENQAVNASCQTLRVERDQLRVQLSEALARASRMDGLLESGKLEKADLLNVYRRACDENARLKRLVHELSTSRAKAVGENQVQVADTSRLRQRLAESEETVRKQQVDLQAYERQVAELSRQMHSIQSRLDLFEEEKSFAERSATSARETTANLAHREQTLKWQLAQQQAEIDKLTLRVSKLSADNEAMHTQLLMERRRYQDLELVVSKARAAQAQASLSEKARAEELHALRTTLLDRELEAERSFAGSTGSPPGRPASRGELLPASAPGTPTPDTPPPQPARSAPGSRGRDRQEQEKEQDRQQEQQQRVNEEEEDDLPGVLPARSPPVSTMTAPTSSGFAEELPTTTAAATAKTVSNSSGSSKEDRGGEGVSSSSRPRTPPSSPELDERGAGRRTGTMVAASPVSPSFSRASSSDLDHMTTELEALISDQSEIIRRIQRDRRSFGQVAADVRQDLETSRSRASIAVAQARAAGAFTSSFSRDDDERPSLHDRDPR
ncbi:Centrosomal protein of 135 kDa [Hondaea fermentalgiana]|uniref:Centrosomal protein of 135 kDa n=1 Tax=Hondaea fermentalgiana TaxID=2315210 RepID=A0A2R5G0S2_9STRA|nr:Centrosomal protein of 135 kDa [Hondaea fermentalgiana]|eukprot:GBG23889.1 Centrosomal protein of 135 kDa [Hondaea fermentalgiana]